MNNDEKLDFIVNKIDQIDSRLDKVDSRLDNLEHDVKDIRLVLENEVRENIRFVADGYAFLRDRMNEVTCTSSDLEMLNVRVNVLESKVRRLEKQA